MGQQSHLGAGPEHWEAIHQQREPEELTWFQPSPGLSLELIGLAGTKKTDRVIDVGGGSAHLCDELIATGFRDVTVLDISPTALAHVGARVGDHPTLTLVEGDIGSFRAQHPFDLWHDRAVFHFLVEDTERVRYLDSLAANLAAGGHVIISTFGLEGSDTCSGLPVRRYGPEKLSAELGGSYEAVAFREELHETPRGAIQHFLYGLFVRV